jgi:GTP-binding protein Era
VDTPGVHQGRGALNQFMVEEAYAALEAVDAVLLVVDAETGGSAALPGESRVGHPAEARLIREAQRVGRKLVLALNKVDRVKDKARLLPLLEAWGKHADFSAIIPTSATRGTGVPEVIQALLSILPEGPALYPPEMLTDRTERFLAGELVREQLFVRLRQELPYATAVVVDNWEERAESSDVVIDATIVVERETQKAIVVGKGGQMIKEIGTAARTEITQLIGRPAHLRLHVKVAPEWTASAESIARLGYSRGGES